MALEQGGLTRAHLDGLGVEEDEAGGQGHRGQHPEDEVHSVRDQSVAVVRVATPFHQVCSHLHKRSSEYERPTGTGFSRSPVEVV